MGQNGLYGGSDVYVGIGSARKMGRSREKNNFSRENMYKGTQRQKGRVYFGDSVKLDMVRA